MHFFFFPTTVTLNLVTGKVYQQVFDKSVSNV